MAFEVTLPCEFIVPGTPVSLQAKRPESRQAWKALVRRCSYSGLPENHFATDRNLGITLFYFPDGEMDGDLDNIVKPVLDALSRHVYIDDRQVERIWVQKFEPGRSLGFSAPSRILARAIDGERPLLYVRVTDAATEGLE